jgi:hypothetical protein
MVRRRAKESKAMKAYEKPRLRSLGSLRTLTQGNGGSCLDGNGENDQRGGGLQEQCGQNDA